MAIRTQRLIAAGVAWSHGSGCGTVALYELWIQRCHRLSDSMLPAFQAELLYPTLLCSSPLFLSALTIKRLTCSSQLPSVSSGRFTQLSPSTSLSPGKTMTLHTTRMHTPSTPHTPSIEATIDTPASAKLQLKERLLEHYGRHANELDVESRVSIASAYMEAVSICCSKNCRSPKSSFQSKGTA